MSAEENEKALEKLKELKGRKKESRKIKELKVKDIENCPICKTWMAFSIAEPQEEDSKKTEIWYREKQNFWDKNKEHLEPKGFSYDSGISKALDYVSVEMKDKLEGSLLIFKIGSELRPASQKDIEMAREAIGNSLEGVKGIRVIVAHHDFTVEKISLPQLRQVQSSVLSSMDNNDDSNPMLKDLEV